MFNFLKPAPAAPQMSMKDIAAKAKAGELLLIDVRERAELAASGTAQHAIHIPVGLIAMKADPKSPDHDKRFKADVPVAVFCASGGRSALAGKVLQEMGFTQVFNLVPFKDWAEGGGAVERPVDKGM